MCLQRQQRAEVRRRRLSVRRQARPTTATSVCRPELQPRPDTRKLLSLKPLSGAGEEQRAPTTLAFSSQARSQLQSRETLVRSR